MIGNEKSVVFIIENVIEALNDIRYEMENFNNRDGFSVEYLNSCISNVEKGLKDFVNNVDGGVD